MGAIAKTRKLEKNQYKKGEESSSAYHPVLFLIRSFCTISNEYPSGSNIKAISLNSPSDSLFFQRTFRSSKRAQAASRSSTEIPVVCLFALEVCAYVAQGLRNEEGGVGKGHTDAATALGFRIPVMVGEIGVVFSAVVVG